MKILSIGNSFSQDAHKWLYKLAKLNEIDVDTVNLYIGGCSLETHWNNYEENNEYYDFEPNGNEAQFKISIQKALEMQKWDIITIQQVSHLSGIGETYEPYLSNLTKEIKKLQPKAKLYFHQTWGYETDSFHEGFLNYNKNQQQMYRQIVSVSQKMAEKINAEIIPAGTVIQKLRESIPEFDYANGGISLCRDGFHLSLDYGRFAAAATWLHTLTGKNITVTKFEDFDIEILQKILDVVNLF